MKADACTSTPKGLGGHRTAWVQAHPAWESLNVHDSLRREASVESVELGCGCLIPVLRLDALSRKV